MKTKTTTTIILSLLALLTVEARLWTNMEGESFDGDLKEVDDNIAIIQRRSDLRIFRVPVKSLSKEDTQYINEFLQKEQTPTKKHNSTPLLPKTDEELTEYL